MLTTCVYLVIWRIFFAGSPPAKGAAVDRQTILRRERFGHKSAEIFLTALDRRRMACGRDPEKQGYEADYIETYDESDSTDFRWKFKGNGWDACFVQYEVNLPN